MARGAILAKVVAAFAKMAKTAPMGARGRLATLGANQWRFSGRNRQYQAWSPPGFPIFTASHDAPAPRADCLERPFGVVIHRLAPVRTAATVAGYLGTRAAVTPSDSVRSGLEHGLSRAAASRIPRLCGGVRPVTQFRMDESLRTRTNEGSPARRVLLAPTVGAAKELDVQEDHEPKHRLPLSFSKPPMPPIPCGRPAHVITFLFPRVAPPHCRRPPARRRQVAAGEILQPRR